MEILAETVRCGSGLHSTQIQRYRVAITDLWAIFKGFQQITSKNHWHRKRERTSKYFQ